jgi:hypothetical protein
VGAQQRTVRFLLAVPLLFAMAGVAPAAPLRFEPDDRKETAAYLEGRTWVEPGPGCEIRLRLLSEDERLAYLEEITGHRIDPYATPPDRDPRFLSFLLEIQNRGEGQMQFQSQSAWLRAGTQIQSPLGIDGLSSIYEVMEMKMGAAYERARPAILEGSSSIGPGETKRGIVVYRMLKQRTKKFFVELQLTLPSGELMRTHAPFRAIKQKKNKKDGKQ